jgi:hypothetical protein
VHSFPEPRSHQPTTHNRQPESPHLYHPPRTCHHQCLQPVPFS